MDLERSQNDTQVRLTAERWVQITDSHPEIARYYFDVVEIVTNPKIVFEANFDELFAVKEVKPGKF